MFSSAKNLFTTFNNVFPTNNKPMNPQNLSEFILSNAQMSKSREEFLDRISNWLAEYHYPPNIIKKCLEDSLPVKRPKDLLNGRYKIVFLQFPQSEDVVIPLLAVKTQNGLEIIGKVYTDNFLGLYRSGDKQKNQVDLIKKLTALEKDINCCYICDKKGCKYKSFSKNRTVYFCSIKCLDSWVY